MRTRRLQRGAGLLLLPSLLAAGSARLAAQAVEPKPDTLALILDELRQLRRSMELTALVQVKLQVAAQRLRVREPQVRVLTEQASQIEQGLAASAADIERARTDLTQVEEKLGQEPTPEARRDLLAQRSALAEAVGHMSAQQEDNQRRAAAVADSLAAERAELDRLTDTLAQLEQTFERQVQAGTVPQRDPARR